MTLSPRKPTVQKRVDDALVASSEPLDARQLATAAGITREQARIAIGRLKAKGRIECVHRQPVYRIIPGTQPPIDQRGRKRV